MDTRVTERWRSCLWCVIVLFVYPVLPDMEGAVRALRLVLFHCHRQT